MTHRFFIPVLFAFCIFSVATEAHAQEAAATATRSIIFPVIGEVNYTDDFGAPRSGGRTHEGNDLLGAKMMPLVAAVDGTLQYVAYPEPSWGYMISIKDDEGYEYNYIHINNDAPGTDDGAGGGMNAYAPDVYQGAKVVKGQLIAWMGDSGNAESTAPHLHFEIRTPDGTAFSPYNSLQAATKITEPTVAPAAEGELLPYGQFSGGVSLAMGNFDTDKKEEILTGAGPGGKPHVKLFEQSGKRKVAFYAFSENFKGGVNVASGDVDGDGVDEIITGAGPGGGPQVRVFDQKGTLIAQFFAYENTFTGGVFVAAADTNLDGKDEIITGPGAGREPHVRVFNLKGKRKYEFLAYKSTMQFGVDVSAIDAATDSPAHIITGSGPGSQARVRVFYPDGVRIKSFVAYDESFLGGVRVDAGFVDPSTVKFDIMTAPANGGVVDFRLFGRKGKLLKSYTEFEPWWIGGYDVAAGNEPVYIGSVGGRRASVRQLE